MMNSINVEDDNVAVLFEQVMGQMVDRCISSGAIDKQQVVVVMEEMIQMIERGTLGSTLENI
jgi:hypothetical protein